MQTSERSTRSTRKFVPEQMASPDPDNQSDTGQYMCIECGETFDTRLELNSHRQSHVTKKQFTCAQCGRGFHHQVFLQMHERSHEDRGSGVKTPPPARVISTRSSKVPDVVHVKPAYTKPQHPLNSIVRFKNEQNVSQTFAPKEFVTRRSHGAAPVSQRSDDLEKDNVFELQISKFTDTTVHLMDSFGNSIEILADVFNTYTIAEPEENGVSADEDHEMTCEKNPSDEISSRSFTEEPSLSPQTEPKEPPPPAGETDLHLSPSHESVSTGKLNTGDPGLPVPESSNLESSAASQPKNMESHPSFETMETASGEENLRPSTDSQEKVNHSQAVDPSNDLPYEDQMDTSPEDGVSQKSPQELQREPKALPETERSSALIPSTADEPVGGTDSHDKRLEDSPSIRVLPVDLPGESKDQSLLGDPGSLKDAAGSVPKTSEDLKQPAEVAEEMIEDVEQNQNLTLLKPDTETGRDLIPPVNTPPERQVSVDVSAYSSPLEGAVLGQSAKEDGDLCDSLSMNGDDASLATEKASIDGRSAEEPGAQNEEANLTSPASESIDDDADIPEKDELQSPSAEKNIHVETDICMTPENVGDVSASQGDVSASQGDVSASQGDVSIPQGDVSIPERSLPVDSKEPEKPCSLLADQDILHDDDLAIDDKKDDDLFERDIFPLEVCEKGLASIEADRNVVCGGDAHRTKVVREKASDICLNSSDMTYISESEMIKLLEQDKDDMADDEPIMAEPTQKPELSGSTEETRSSRSPVKWGGEQSTVDDLLTSKHRDLPASAEQNTLEVQRLSDLPTYPATPEEKMDADSCLPLSFLSNDEPRTGNIEPQDPTKSMLTQDSVSKEQLGFTETPSISKFQLLTQEGNPVLSQPERSFLSGDQKYEPCTSSSGNLDVNPVGDSALSRMEDTTSQENNDVFVTVEDNECEDTVQQIDTLESPSRYEKPPAATPEYKEPVSAVVCRKEPEQSKMIEHEGKNLASSQSDPEPLPTQETENPPVDVLDYMQSTNDDHGDHTNTSSSDIREGMLNKQVEPGAIFLPKNIEAETDTSIQEQTTDLSSDLDRFSKTLSTPKNAESKLPPANADLGGLEGSSVLKDVKEDLEKASVASPKAANDDIVSEVMEDDGGSGTKQVLDVSPVDQPVCQDSLEDSELIENEADHTDTPPKSMGVGGECLKCGRKLRRGRKELIWLPVCFKCRKAAKRKERLAIQGSADGLAHSVEPLKSRREESLSAELSDSHIKQDGGRLQKNLSGKATTISDPLFAADEEAALSSAKKRYKCPKCDETFRIPALLAGHIKCHTLPQCLTCGCQMPLKYKTKRIPRRCQKCVQQLKEKIRAKKKVGGGSGDEDSSSSDNEEAVSLIDINPDEDDVSDEDSCLAVQKAKKKPLKPLDDEDSVKAQEMESSDELDTSDQNIGLPDSKKPRLCPQCGKAFPCNRSLNLHLLSHTGIQCETCGCRLPKRRRVGRWSKKCRSCRLQMKDKLLNDSEDEMGVSGDKLLKQKNAASLRLKAKQSKALKNAKIQSVLKKKKELKWMNMLLAVKGLMDKSRKKKENALKAADLAKKEGESSEAEKCDVSSAENSSGDQPKSDLHPDTEKAGPSKLSSDTPKQGRKCLYREKNIIKVEESDVLPYVPSSDGSNSTAFIKQEEMWQCLECTQSWPNSEALVNHQHSHMTGQSFTCPQCPQVFSTEQYLDIHIHAHDEDRPFRCPECDKTFTKRNHLGVHMRVHSGSRPFACPDCPCRFRQKVTLIAHRYSHRNYQLLFTKPFQCSVCSKSFKQKERLVIHERIHTGECPFSCKDCDKVFPSKSRLYVHRKMHKFCDAPSDEQSLSGQEVSEGQPFKCQDCGKICTTKASFVLHSKVHRLSSIPVQSIKREQSEEVLGFTCKECNKVFSSKYSLRMHSKNHCIHKTTTKSEINLDLKEGFPCQDCDKICSTKASLVLHHRVHRSPSAGEQNLVIKVEPDTPSYICKICSKVCSTKGSLVLHRKVHKIPMGTDTETAPFRCKDCDMVCSTKASFVLHRKVHRASSSNQLSPKADAEPQLYTCKHCDMVCSTKASFALHSKVHKSLSIDEQNVKTDAEPQSYNCKHCDMVCSTKASFALHSKVHRALINEQSPKVMEEPQSYNCKYCDMVCSTKASFVLHSKVHRSLFGEEPKTPEETYNCKHCDMVCSTKASFVLHSKVHRLSSGGEQSHKAAEELKSYSCKECDMVCSTKASFVLHSRVHRSGQDSEETSFTCKDCNKVCSTKASFNLHRRVHKSSGSEHQLGPKGDGEEPIFQCQECGKIFSSKGRLSAHSKVHEDSSDHNQDANDGNAEQPKKTNEEKPFPCTICGMRFMKLKVLVRHKAIHGERTVTPCTHCGKQFLYMKSLFNHIKMCQSKAKGKKRLLKKVAAKRKISKDGGSTSSDGESAQKKPKMTEKQKALKAAQKIKNKNLMVKAKKAAAGKEKGKGKAAGATKTKEKRANVDSDVSAEGEGKKMATEKQSDGKQEKPAEQTAKEPTPKKTVTPAKKAKKEPAKDKPLKAASGGPKKWRVLAATTAKKKNLQAVLIGGKKKLLVKKKVQLKPKAGGKAGKD
ncbi:uncharacterized protein ACMZJ9_020888 [Mantella aurantiaca]